MKDLVLKCPESYCKEKTAAGIAGTQYLTGCHLNKKLSLLSSVETLTGVSCRLRILSGEPLKSPVYQYLTRKSAYSVG